MALNAQEMVELLQAAVVKNIGVQQVIIDGQTIQFNREQLIAELAYWQSQAAKKSGARPLFRGFNLGSAWGGGNGSNGI
jgi:hypothetical protein